MFKQTITIPKINDDLIRAIDGIIPGIAQVVNFPTITTNEEAIQFAFQTANKTLPGTEYVSSASIVEETLTGWVVELTIFGD